MSEGRWRHWWGEGLVGGAEVALESFTRAPLGYFYNAPHWGGAISSPPPSDLRNYWTDSKNSSGI